MADIPEKLSTQAPMHIGNRVDKIFMSFLKQFFSGDMPPAAADFKYVDNRAPQSLIIQMTEDTDVETVNALPSIVLQDGGWRETRHSLNDRHAWVLGERVTHKTVIVSVMTIHCLARRRGSAKLLQSIVAQSVITFRRVLGALGIDTIPDVQAMPPVKLSDPVSDSGPYDAALMFECYHSLDWYEEWGDDFEEEFLITLKEALECDAGDGGATRTQIVPAYTPPET